jgi:hypothetical protein
MESELIPTPPLIEDAPAGTLFRDGPYLWTRVRVLYGRGRWGYWLNQAESTICADTLFNSNAPHFAGFLANPYTGPLESIAWLLVEPCLHPPVPHPLYI